MASTRISDIRGPQGLPSTVPGPQGAPGVNAIPADDFIADRMSTPGTATEGALAAKQEAAVARRVDRAWLAATGLSVRPSIIRPNEWQADRAPTPLAIPTYDGSNQTVHPDVFFAPDGWGADADGKSWKWWMVHTPYPASNSIYENPSVVVSDDGEAWINPPGLTNPIVPQPTDGGYCSDGELNLDRDGVLYLTYRWVRGSTEQLCWRSTADGINWTAEASMFTVTAVGNGGCVSPTIAYDAPTGKWRMWTGRMATPGPILDMRTADAIKGPWSEPVACTTPLPAPPAGAEHELWHFDVISYGGQYVMLANTLATSVGQRHLYLGGSFDGLSWEFGKRPIIVRGGGGKWDENPYRGCLVPVSTARGNALRVYYSANTSTTGWAVGRTEIRPNPTLVSRTGAFGPEEHGLLGWTADPILAVGASNAVASGSATYVLVKVAVGGYVKEVIGTVTTAGVGLVSGQNYFAIYDAAGNRLAQTADISSTLGSTGTRGFVLTAPTRYLEAGELVLVAYVFNGTTAPKFAGMPNPIPSGVGRNATPSSLFYPPRAGRFGSALTTPPETVTTISGDAWFPWVGLFPA